MSAVYSGIVLFFFFEIQGVGALLTSTLTISLHTLLYTVRVGSRTTVYTRSLVTYASL